MDDNLDDMKAKSPRSKDDFASDKENAATAAQFDTQTLKIRRTNRWVLIAATVLTAVFVIMSFVLLICTLVNFTQIYTYHNTAVAMHGDVNLAKFAVMLIPAAAYSTVFIVSLVSLLRFVAGFAGNSASSQSSDNEEANAGLLAGIISRLMAGS